MYCRIGLILTLLSCSPGLTVEPDDIQAIRLSVFVRGDLPSAKAVDEYVEVLRRQVTGLDVQIYDVLQDRAQLAILYELSKKAGRDTPVLPAFFCCDRMYFGFVDAEKTGPEIERLFTAELYSRPTCPRCNSLKAFLPSLQKRWPAIRFRIHDVDKDSGARARWQSLCQASGTPPGLPTIDFARRVIIGYQGDNITGAQLESLIKQVSGAPLTVPAKNKATGYLDQLHLRTWSPAMISLFSVENLLQDAADVEPSEIESSGSLELPDEATVSEVGEVAAAPAMFGQEGESDAIEVPLFGRIRVSDLGLPLFTLAVGIVDGFNPCAMWILVFLMSVLVNIKDRTKILLIAGTFVIVSGLAYFAFMAAWLNLFLLVGIIRPVQIALGLLALFIGVVNVKDFFAFKKGISLSIPEKQKPVLYRRVREIVNAQYLTVALSGAVALAIVVNMIELLCTAGLPALYTQVLTLQNLSRWNNYAYLALYVAAYMFDDLVLVAIVVTTLSHRRLQEREGRWLKLMSGLVILILGLIMLFKPTWLQLGTV